MKRFRRLKRVLLQLLKFGVSGILGVAISTILYYDFKGQLPDLFWTVLFYRFNAVDVGFYELTAMIGGTVHFLLSKTWVFEK
jgi:putative flippase GtrA